MHINNSACTTKKQNSSLHMCMPSSLARQVHNTYAQHASLFSKYVAFVCFYAQSDRAFRQKLFTFVCQVATLRFKVSAAALIRKSLSVVPMDAGTWKIIDLNTQNYMKQINICGNILTAYKKSKTRQFLGATYN
jgi:hypothetical protein